MRARLNEPQVTFSNEMEVLALKRNSRGEPVIEKLPKFLSTDNGIVAAKTVNNSIIHFTLDPELQLFASNVIKKANAQHAAVVAMDPISGKILAMAGKSPVIEDMILHNGFKAASILKL